MYRKVNMFPSRFALKLLFLAICHFTISYQAQFLSLQIAPEESTYEAIININDTDISLNITKDDIIKQHAILGLRTNLTSAQFCSDEPNCIQFASDGLRLRVENVTSHSFDIAWTTHHASEETFQDCFDLERTNMHWFGGPEFFTQMWPIEHLALNDMVNMPHQQNAAAITEGYWLNSRGIYIYVHQRVPLFIDQNFQKMGYVCFAAKVQNPYRSRKELMLKYTLGVFDDPKEAHLDAVNNFLGKPKGHPSMAIIENPIWSTWARYYRGINDSVILEFAQEIADRGFTGQFEIDDYWETCYGSLEFSQEKFPNIKKTLQTIKNLGFRTSLWTHPFVNKVCKDIVDYGTKMHYFAMNSNDSMDTSWWNSGQNEAHHLDFTNKNARAWFNQRLNKLRDDIGIDTFKFDAGESSWTPQPPKYNGIELEDSPQGLTTAYVENCAQYGDAIEIRTGWRTQHLPVFVRMIDKDSAWGFGNGLYTLITTLLQMNMNGYTMVLPDMVGGNGYYGRPTAELFVRWLQANTFMPSIQFSLVPWDYQNNTEFDVLEISRKFVKLHAKYAPEIKKAMETSIKEGHPVNGPVWWADPENADAHNVFSQYLLGSDIVVAPVIMEGHTSRDVFLPKGTWIDGNTGVEYEGPQKIKKYPAPIDVLPFFTRK